MSAQDGVHLLQIDIVAFNNGHECEIGALCSVLCQGGMTRATEGSTGETAPSQTFSSLLQGKQKQLISFEKKSCANGADILDGPLKNITHIVGIIETI